MLRSLPSVGFVVVATALVATAGEPLRPSKPAPLVLGMSEPVACLKIDGYEQFEELPAAAITSEEKLKVYYRPSGYKIERQGKKYVARFVQDGVIRPKGQKKVVWKKDGILEYEARSDTPPEQIYLTNLVGLKGLPPGEYELTITLRDDLRPKSTETATTTATLPFRIIPTPPAPGAPAASPRP